jgi:uncharacterized protein YcaQ
MKRVNLPEPTLTISKRDARRFLLAHHSLWPPRKLKGKDGILDYIQHVNCIQYDPVNIVGRNPDLTLQSRIIDYRPEYLDQLLYADRKLLDGFDKVQSIYLVSDWPYFSHFRTRTREKHGRPDNPPMQIAAQVKDAIQQRGPLSSLDLKSDDTIDWWWGVKTRLPRASLEILYLLGEVGIHHRVNTRRVFDLIERLLPEDVLSAPDPNESLADYQVWHVLRRVAGLGIANPAGTDHWLEMLDLKSARRREILKELVENGDLIAIQIESLQDRTFFIRRQDLKTLKYVLNSRAPKARAAFIAPLDNLMWDRDMLRWVFDFDYIWEIYKPADQRRYGYYVLPVLYGDRFIARVDPAFDKKSRILTIQDWWWETGVKLNGKIERALLDAFSAFADYMSANRILLSEKVSSDGAFAWLVNLVVHLDSKIRN